MPKSYTDTERESRFDRVIICYGVNVVGSKNVYTLFQPNLLTESFYRVEVVEDLIQNTESGNRKNFSCPTLNLVVFNLNKIAIRKK